jgi:hypothetical protein
MLGWMLICSLLHLVDVCVLTVARLIYDRWVELGGIWWNTPSPIYTMNEGDGRNAWGRTSRLVVALQ